ncbi:11756_t:CDS:2 [Diversispora eburnea]|uniref:11756_t:CDS:1 n=1 Tax=Diversispora eburnea TaxID=1213867 RepID=A0A9N9FL89_9GLOM|nr:11756_t:CDS:2 [Diversispora eburnea]
MDPYKVPSKLDPDTIYTVTEKDLQKSHEFVKLLYVAGAKETKKSRIMKPNEQVHKPSGLTIYSWKTNDWNYKKGILPTKARGLFTRVTENHKHEILIRGYDKFFNVNEWENIYANTKSPYEITHKENGCIIFISGLPGDHILITSKHSLGEKQKPDEITHAGKGEEWLNKHLEKVGKSKKDLASYLYKYKLTAVAELCDDSFQEHVLEYTPEQSGLRLHGINYNLPELKTWPMNYVTAFAEEWGFHKTKYSINNFIPDNIKEKNSEEHNIEGFVIRTKLKSSNEDFFFKIKKEPYLLYREWREITKALLAKKNPRPTYKLSKHYIEWVKEKMKSEPSLFKDYTHYRGIIRIRDLFLEYWENQGFKKSFEKISEKKKEPKPKQYKKTLIVPIATNDDIQNRSKFHDAIIKQFEDINVVFADRNNHLINHRETLIKAVRDAFPNDVRTIAIYWDHHKYDFERISEITSERISSRGNNHQTLKAENPKLNEIIWRFLNEFEPLGNHEMCNLFDHAIELDILDNTETNLMKVIEKLHSIIGIEIPSEERIKAVLKEANNYTPEIHKIVSKNVDNKVYKILKDNNRIIVEPHVTLIHRSVKKLYQDYWEKCKVMCAGEPQEVKVYIDKLVLTNELMTFVVKKTEPEVECKNKVPHVTVGTINKKIKPSKSNEVLENSLINGITKNMEIVQLDSELILTGIIKKFQ